MLFLNAGSLLTTGFSPSRSLDFFPLRWHQNTGDVTSTRQLFRQVRTGAIDRRFRQLANQCRETRARADAKTKTGLRQAASSYVITARGLARTLAGRVRARNK